MGKRSQLTSLPFLALYGASIGAVVLSFLRTQWGSATWFPIAVGLTAALAIAPIKYLMGEQLVGPSARRPARIGFLFFGGFLPLVGLPFLGRQDFLLMIGLILMSAVFFWGAFGSLFWWPGFREPRRRTEFGIQPEDNWQRRSLLVSDVPFDIAFVVQRQFVIMRKQRFSARDKSPKLQGELLEQPDFPGFDEGEHGYFRRAFTKNVIGHEGELARYYRSVLAICRNRGLDPGNDSDCRSCFGIVPLICPPNQMFRPAGFSDVGDLKAFITMMLAPGDGEKFAAVDQTGDDTIEARGDFIHLHQSNSGKELINVRFLRGPFENQIKDAMERFETIVRRLHDAHGISYWMTPDQSWSVYRQDDNGNRFAIQRGLKQTQAEERVRQFEALGHKQTYWSEPDRRGS